MKNSGRDEFTTFDQIGGQANLDDRRRPTQTRWIYGLPIRMASKERGVQGQSDE